MPTAGTHITLLEQLLLRHQDLVKTLGDPLGNDDKIRYAKLGSIGPDFLYMLADYNVSFASSLQDMASFLVKVGGTCATFGELSEQINSLITKEIDKNFMGIATAVQQSVNLLKGVITNGFLALLVDNGVNLWGYFGASSRQWGEKPEAWFWADYLHYYHPGDFTLYLVHAARETKDENLIAYALGYVTHYITDVVGHPYVNQIVQSPYRLHHQRHHLVENFMDAYIWDRYHKTAPLDPNSIAEPPLDIPTSPNPLHAGAPLLAARLNDHINIGNATLNKQLDKEIQKVCDEIKNVINQAGTWIGLQEEITVDPPKDNSGWCKFMADTIKNYCDEKRNQSPTVFKSPLILERGSNPRAQGYPKEDDIAQAYGILRLIFKIQTETKIAPPVFPDITGDITQLIEDIMSKVASDIGSIPPIPVPNTSGSFSLSNLLTYLANLAQWTAEVAEHLGEALVDFAKGLGSIPTALALEAVKVTLWLIDTALYSLYRSFQEILVINGYSIPLTDEIDTKIGDLDTKELWVTKGNLPNQNTAKNYPVAEYYVDKNKSDRLLTGSDYKPYVVPAVAQPGEVELPEVPYTAPYRAGDCPDSIIDMPAGPDNFFAAASIGQNSPETKAGNFGGALENCYKAIATFTNPKYKSGDLALPNFDMDSDRGYGWLNWRPSDGVWKNLDPAQNTNRPLTIQKPELLP